MKPKLLTHFDESIAELVRAARTSLGDQTTQDGVLVRDTTGRLCFVASRASASDEERTLVTTSLQDTLGAYARSNRLVSFLGDPGTDALLSDTSRFPVRVDGLDCQLIDRRIVGTAWLDRPVDVAARPPRVVFASLKGGVGRSSALAITAADLARRNMNVLVVDLDLEAPGIGDLLLDSGRMPQFGVVDFLVENGIGGVPDAMLEDFVGISALTTGGGGRVDVVPALGTKSFEAPENILPKLARAMIEDLTTDGDTISVGQQISEMLSRLTVRAEYDVVLIDSRAGLAELAAPTLIGLGATILLFGTAQKQTIRGYEALFAGLGMLAKRDKAQGRKAEWRFRLKAVYAKASMNEDVLAQHRDALYDLFSEKIYDEDLGSLTDVNFGIDEVSAPHLPLIIPFNQSFVDFDPLRDRSQLTKAFYEQSYRPFLDGFDTLIEEYGSPVESTESTP